MIAFSMIDTLLYIDSYHGTFSLIVQKRRKKVQCSVNRQTIYQCMYLDHLINQKKKKGKHPVPLRFTGLG
jgi:hypothetical protein